MIDNIYAPRASWGEFLRQLEATCLAVGREKESELRQLQRLATKLESSRRFSARCTASLYGINLVRE